VWSWWQEGSIHRSAWPDAAALRVAAAGPDVDAADGDDPDAGVLTVAAEVLGAIRKAKSEARRSMRTEVVRATVIDTPDRLALLDLAAHDVRSAGHVVELVTVEGDALAVAVELAPEP
jgi:valyl-tRNA synthetase